MPKRKLPQTPFSPWYRTHWDKVVLLVGLGVFILLTPGQNQFLQMLSSLQMAPLDADGEAPAPTAAPYPINHSALFPGEEISATGVVVYDLHSGVYLYERNSESSLSPASTTKLLTALVALDHWKLDDVLTVKTVLTEGQKMDVIVGEQLTLENLLYGALIHSANDATYVIAENYPGGVEAFVAAMNVKASTIHLLQSHFTNPVGYDNPAHKMTARDLVTLARVGLSNSTIAKMVAIPEITISDVTHTTFHHLKNVNELLGKIPGVGGIKTGWTEEAGENLVTLVDRNGHKVIIVVLHSKDRFADTIALINWVYANIEWKTF